MDQIFPTEAIQSSSDFLTYLQNFGIGLLQPWKAYQLGILLACLAVAWLLARILSPRFRNWIRSLSGNTAIRLRMLLILNRRLTHIIFTTFAWGIYWLMQNITWPSRSNLIGTIAALATIWLIISLIARNIKNRYVRRVFSWSGWIIATLYMLGMLQPTSVFLDSIAVELAGVRVSALLVFKAFLTITLLILVARTLSKSAARKIESVEDISPSMKVLSIKGLQFILYGAALVFGIQSIGFDLTSLTVLSGAIGLGLGFGLQKVVSNLVSGVILLLDKSIKPGDVISLGDTFGWISTLGARYVSVLTRDGREYLIPNEDLITNQVVNWSHSSELVRLDIKFGVSYASNPRDVKRVAMKAPLKCNRVIKLPAPVCHVVDFGESSINFLLRFWIKDPTGGLTNIRGDVYLELWDALKENGIQIPYPRRDVTLLPPHGVQPASVPLTD